MDWIALSGFKNTKHLRTRLVKGMIIDDNGCWLWCKYIDQYGYGQISVDNRSLGVHRVSYWCFNGPIADNLQVDHKCRVRRCLNPEHLEAVTVSENNLRKNRRVSV